MRPINFVLAILLLITTNCDDDKLNINSKGLVKLDIVGIQSSGWGLSSLVVSHEGTTIYYGATNFQTDQHELRQLDSNGRVTTLFSGDGQLNALDISEDDNTLLYTVSTIYGTKIARLYEYPLAIQVPTKLLEVTHDGAFWDAHFLPNGDIVYTQGDGLVQLSLRRINRASREVTLLLDKTDNPLLIDVDNDNERLLIQGWTNSRIITMNFDGTDVKDFGEQKLQVNAVCFSPDGSEILAYDATEIIMQAISYDVNTGQKNTITNAPVSTWPVAYGQDKNEIITRQGNSFPKELSIFNRTQNKFHQLTSNEVDEFFLGYYNNSTRRILFQAVDQYGNNALFILNR